MAKSELWHYCIKGMIYVCIYICILYIYIRFIYVCVSRQVEPESPTDTDNYYWKL